MILVLSHIEADKLNRQKAIEANCNWPNAKLFSTVSNENYTALIVGDGEGLTEDELAKCEEMPEDFDGYVPQRFRPITDMVVIDKTAQFYCNVTCKIDGVDREFTGYYYPNNYWDNYTVMEWIVEQ